MTKVEDVQGTLFLANDRGGIVPIQNKICVRITSDEIGKTLSLADEKNMVMLQIPLEAISDLVEVKF